MYCFERSVFSKDIYAQNNRNSKIFIEIRNNVPIFEILRFQQVNRLSIGERSFDISFKPPLVDAQSVIATEKSA